LTVLHWLITNTAGNFIVDTLFAIPGWIAYIRIHRKMDRHHQWHLDQHKP
jgi:hypothetical protein